MPNKSNISKFYQMSRQVRLQLLLKKNFLTEESAHYFLNNHLLSDDIATSLIENQIGQYPLPYGVALNFLVDNKDVIIPMVIEEPSVVAACSNAARLIRKAGGFTTAFDVRLQTGQIIFYNINDIDFAINLIKEKKSEIIDLANNIHPSIVKRGGGVKDIETKVIIDENNNSEYLTIYLYIDVQEAMGANIVNTILEGVSPIIQGWINADKLMCILSNYNDRSLVTSTCKVNVTDLENELMSGIEVASKIVKASQYAKLDIYRAVTNNKGIMNGVDAVVMATGNDYRAIEAGIHAYASRNGKYEGLSTWSLSNDNNYLEGVLTIPMMIGSLGGAISALPIARLSQELMQTTSANVLSRIIVSTGLAQNFSALKALVTEGIQKGHMGLHANALAIHAGAKGEEITLLAEKLRNEEIINLALAQKILSEIRQK